MSDGRFLAGGIMALGLAVLGGYGLSQSAVMAQDAADGPGPNLSIEVAGEANGTVVIDLMPEVAPKHVAQITALAEKGAYDGVVFHRVIEGFMAQTGDVQYGKGSDLSSAGMGGSDLPDIPAEFSDVSFERGVVGMARSQSPDSANSQFFIMFAPGDFLNGQYTVVGKVISGMDVVDSIAKGEPPRTPDVMTKVTVAP
ncbi:peptidylprolyl isomerase [Cereibacter changlensis JA139]|uniref:Peptidyl-prolyl cis-trans isomerase n=2 Tax=Cereibacter changlensis TaxID=402884 RepID=A0A2T4JYY1_9RHOB|nr:peptidylprolyl isomerase [Cereibacter changlensis]PTE23017.1 peptidylprolyl isomerase [Cereibacter changlensis JA139]